MNDDRRLPAHLGPPRGAAAARSTARGRDLVPVLARQADVLRAESDFLDELARAAWPEPTAEPSARGARRRCTRRSPAARSASWLGAPPPSLAEVERVLAVARGERRGRASSPADGARPALGGGRACTTASTVSPP